MDIKNWIRWDYSEKIFLNDMTTQNYNYSWKWILKYMFIVRNILNYNKCLTFLYYIFQIIN